MADLLRPNQLQQIQLREARTRFDFENLSVGQVGDHMQIIWNAWFLRKQAFKKFF